MSANQFVKRLMNLGYWAENLEPSEIDIVSAYENVTCKGCSFPRELADIDIGRHCLNSGGILPDSVWLLLKKALNQKLNYDIIFNKKSWLNKAEKNAFAKPHVKQIKNYPNFKYKTCSLDALKVICKKSHTKIIRDINNEDITDYIVPLDFDRTRIGDYAYTNSHTLATISTITLGDDISSNFCILANRNISDKLFLAIIHYTNFLKDSRNQKKIKKCMQNLIDKKNTIEYLSHLIDIKNAINDLNNFTKVSKKFIKLYTLIINSISNYGINMGHFSFAYGIKDNVPLILNKGQAIEKQKCIVKRDVDNDKFKKVIQDSKFLINLNHAPLKSWFIEKKNKINYVTPQDIKDIQQTFKQSLNTISKFKK